MRKDLSALSTTHNYALPKCPYEYRTGTFLEVTRTKGNINTLAKEYNMSHRFLVATLIRFAAVAAICVNAYASPAVDNAQSAKSKLAVVDEIPTLLEKIGISGTRPVGKEELTRLKIKSGLVLEAVDGASAISGIQPGDILISINGRETNFGNIKKLPDNFPSTLVLLVVREDERIPIAVQLPPRNRALFTK